MGDRELRARIHDVPFAAALWFRFLPAPVLLAVLAVASCGIRAQESTDGAASRSAPGAAETADATGAESSDHEGEESTFHTWKERLEALPPEARDELDRRRIRLFESIKCSCPREDWTRTLVGCFENCANGQKGRIEERLLEGWSDDEIKREMVRVTGTDEVLVKPRGIVDSVGAYVIFGIAAVVGVLLLLWSTRGGDERPRNDAPPASEWDERIDEELRRLDDE